MCSYFSLKDRFRKNSVDYYKGTALSFCFLAETRDCISYCTQSANWQQSAQTLNKLSHILFEFSPSFGKFLGLIYICNLFFPYMLISVFTQPYLPCSFSILSFSRTTNSLKASLKVVTLLPTNLLSFLCREVPIRVLYVSVCPFPRSETKTKILTLFYTLETDLINFIRQLSGYAGKWNKDWNKISILNRGNQ